LTDHNANVYSKNLRILGGNYVFDVEGTEGHLKDVHLNVGGWHNIENALAAITACRKLGLTGDRIIPALHKFRGVRRRFEYHVQGGGPVYLDDYAHHPRELDVLISSARELFPDRKMILIFQPHLFSRTKDFADAFAAMLDKADEVILLPLYPAREQPMEGVSSVTILEKMVKAPVQIMRKQEVLERAKSVPVGERTIWITAGAGDIDELVNPLTEILKVK
jgi:UDP-N-acetylmuramate--alanine ligase